MCRSGYGTEGLSMTQLLDHIEFLTKEVGARPAGTEEEQQSALYIADQLQRDAGFHAEIEEFTSSSNLEGARAIPSVVIVLVVILAMIFNVLTIPALILTIAAAAIYALEAFDHPVLSKMLSRGASQNVVAKYQPGNDSSTDHKRVLSRKVILVAHYDSGKVKPRVLEMIDSTGLPIGLICIGAMAASILFLLVRIFVGGAGGVATVVLNVLTIIALIIVALPIVKAVLYRVAPYNEGANNNASGVAAIIEVARRISIGSASEADLAALSQEVAMHGEEAVLESGLVPEGVEIVYEKPEEPEVVDEFENYTEEERLLAAKAAIAALTGQPVESRVFASEPSEGNGTAAESAKSASESVAAGEPQESAAQAQEEASWQRGGAQAGLSQAAAPQAAVASVPAATAQPSAEPDAADAAGFQNAPSWFVAAQRNAKKPVGEAAEIQRSRYTEAIENAEREAAARERAREEEERARREESTRAAIVASCPKEDEVQEQPVIGQAQETAPAPEPPAPIELPTIEPVSVPTAQAEEPVEAVEERADAPEIALPAVEPEPPAAATAEPEAITEVEIPVEPEETAETEAAIAAEAPAPSPTEALGGVIGIDDAEAIKEAALPEAAPTASPTASRRPWPPATTLATTWHGSRSWNPSLWMPRVP